MIFDLFSSVRFGILLLILLFVYSSIGSAGILYPTSFNIFHLDNWQQIVVREKRNFEMTEFEWFHWWPFKALIALICLTMATTTLRRIPLRPVNFGVWMIHVGIITLSLGSVWYFSAKVEGDVLLFRRQVIAQAVGDAQPVQFTAALRSSATLPTSAGPVALTVVSVDPEWELLTGEDAGKRVYAVGVQVRMPDGETFVRQLLDGYPEFTEDVIPGQGRAVKVTGERLLDESLQLTLAPKAEDWFYLVHSDALYLREVGTSEWIERPIPQGKLPRYNDSVAEPADLWPVPRDAEVAIDALEITAPASSHDDPLAGATISIDSYLRYAVINSRRVPGGNVRGPILNARLVSPEGSSPIQMVADDPVAGVFAGGFARFLTISNDAQLDAIIARAGGMLTVTTPETAQPIEIPIVSLPAQSENAAAQPIAGTEWSVQLVRLDRISPNQSGEMISVAFLDLAHSDGRAFRRWVFDQPRFNRDQMLNPDTGEYEMVTFDESIQIVLTPDSPVVFVAGPQPDMLRIITVNAQTRAISVEEISLREPLELGPSLGVVVDGYSYYSQIVSRPQVVPISQRVPEHDMTERLIRIALPSGPGKPAKTLWLPYHQYPYAGPNDTLPGDRFAPTKIKLSDGREIEILYSRQRRPLPQPMTLDRFEVDYQTGGFSGSNLSVDEWRSIVRFDSDATENRDASIVAVNAPAEQAGYWFFQAQWDPPRQGSAGLNYTVLGVGNRAGVVVQLLGCCIAVLGMIYAFYIKPMIKQRQRDAVYAKVTSGVASATASPARVLTVAEDETEEVT